jgi:hypothetical protein
MFVSQYLIDFLHKLTSNSKISIHIFSQSISTLYSFHLITPKIKTVSFLSISVLEAFLIHINQSTMITHFTTFGCSINHLYQLFDYLINLNYFNIHLLCKSSFLKEFIQMLINTMLTI